MVRSPADLVGLPYLSPFSPILMLVLDTVAVFVDEDTNMQHTHKLAIPYNEICGPIADASYLWEEYDHVTMIQDTFGNRYHVLEPFAKVFDAWLKALEQEQHKGITFSAQ